VLVPSLSGRTEADARARLATNGLEAEIVPQESEKAPGLVVATEPQEGGPVDRRSRVRLFVSTGLELPKAVGETLGEARRRLTGYEVEAAEVASAELKGIVVEQAPAAAARVAAGTRVRLTVSDGSLVVVPDLQSTTLAQARPTLQDTSLVFALSSGPNVANAVVKAQRPAARTVVERGSKVEIEVRPPMSWIIGVLGLVAVGVGYFVWLWRRVPSQDPGA
jgi:serine/threonine-protein kinase